MKKEVEMKRARNEGNEIYRMHGVSLKVSPWRLWVQSAVLGVLVLILSLPAKAAVFNVGSGNVVELINAINLANANGDDDTINLESGSYTLTQENNVTDGSNGLPSITTPIEIIGAGSDTTIVRRLGETLPFQVFFIKIQWAVSRLYIFQCSHYI